MTKKNLCNANCHLVIRFEFAALLHFFIFFFYSVVFDDQGQILNNEFYLSFLSQLKGMALETYYIQQLRPEEGNNP